MYLVTKLLVFVFARVDLQNGLLTTKLMLHWPQKRKHPKHGRLPMSVFIFLVSASTDNLG